MAACPWFEYTGKWVALQGTELICSGSGSNEVRDEARAKGIVQPLVVRLPEEPDRLSARLVSVYELKFL